MWHKVGQLDWYTRIEILRVSRGGRCVHINCPLKGNILRSLINCSLALLQYLWSIVLHCSPTKGWNWTRLPTESTITRELAAYWPRDPTQMAIKILGAPVSSQKQWSAASSLKQMKMEVKAFPDYYDVKIPFPTHMIRIYEPCLLNCRQNTVKFVINIIICPYYWP